MGMKPSCRSPFEEVRTRFRLPADGDCQFTAIEGLCREQLDGTTNGPACVIQVGTGSARVEVNLEAMIGHYASGVA